MHASLTSVPRRIRLKKRAATPIALSLPLELQWLVLEQLADDVLQMRLICLVSWKLTDCGSLKAVCLENSSSLISHWHACLLDLGSTIHLSKKVATPMTLFLPLELQWLVLNQLAADAVQIRLICLKFWIDCIIDCNTGFAGELTPSYPPLRNLKRLALGNYLNSEPVMAWLTRSTISVDDLHIGSYCWPLDPLFGKIGGTLHSLTLEEGLNRANGPATVADFEPDFDADFSFLA
ncbi:hypothetical protein B0H11DRAFT_2253177 [Mycena galericulata]|nr:hypothetical protein B0H11DRAFT_2253177 [Mycena galericulata]